MTMDIHQRSVRPEQPTSLAPLVRPSPEGSAPSPPVTESPQRPIKRSFDVAFLMAPDDLSTKRRQQQLRLVTSASLMQRYSSPEMVLSNPQEAVELKISRTLNQPRHCGRGNLSDFPTLPTSPLGLLIPSPKDYQKSCPSSRDSVIDITQDEQSLQFAKSAFTKVKGGKLEYSGAPNTPASPSSVSSTMSGGLSPDISYQESLSPSLLNSNSRSPVHYLQASKSLNPNMAYFASGGKPLPPMNPASYFYNNQHKEKMDVKPSAHIEPNGFPGNFVTKGPTIDPMQKLRPMLYQGGETLPYPALPVTAYPFPPAAPLLTALLPSSLAALTLPAQNVCAKCKISFRMTSDLVYHMRSHHKGEHVTVDPGRRRRDQDKLRCPVCDETFRERHHLTRHMTAHQDKDGDLEDDQDTRLRGLSLQ